MNHVTSTSARERAARHALERMGYKLQKARTQNPSDYTFGTYMIVDPFRNAVVAGMPSGFGMHLEDVEGWIEG